MDLHVYSDKDLLENRMHWRNNSKLLNRISYWQRNYLTTTTTITETATIAISKNKMKVFSIMQWKKYAADVILWLCWEYQTHTKSNVWIYMWNALVVHSLQYGYGWVIFQLKLKIGSVSHFYESIFSFCLAHSHSIVNAFK